MLFLKLYKPFSPASGLSSRRVPDKAVIFYSAPNIKCDRFCIYITVIINIQVLHRLYIFRIIVQTYLNLYIQQYNSIQMYIYSLMIYSKCIYSRFVSIYLDITIYSDLYLYNYIFKSVNKYLDLHLYISNYNFIFKIYKCLYKKYLFIHYYYFNLFTWWHDQIHNDLRNSTGLHTSICISLYLFSIAVRSVLTCEWQWYYL